MQKNILGLIHNNDALRRTNGIDLILRENLVEKLHLRIKNDYKESMLVIYQGYSAEIEDCILK